MRGFGLVATVALAATAAASPAHRVLARNSSSSSVSVRITPSSTHTPRSTATPSTAKTRTASSSAKASSTRVSRSTATSSTVKTTSSSSTKSSSTSSHSTSTSKTCTAGDTASTGGVQKLLDSTGAIDWLDLMLGSMSSGEKDWVNKLWDIEFPNEGASPLTGCGDIGSDCSPNDMCSEYPDEQAYWVFRSVSLLHSKINVVHDKLLWTGWLDGLSIDQIAKDFSSTSPDAKWAKWISAAFTMAGGIATGVDLSKPLRGMVGFASGGLTEIGNTESSGDQVDKTSVENTLRNVVGAAGNYVASVSQNATGNGNPDTLPIYTESTLQHATARFFSDNTILLDENKDNSSFVSAYDMFAENVEKKLVDIAMKTAWYVLVGEQDVSEKECTMTGAYWLEAKSGVYRCFYLSKPGETHDCQDNDPSTCVSDAWLSPYNSNNKFDNKIYTKLTDTYGFDLKAYYVSLIDCYMNGNGTIDMTATTNDGKIPRCFYDGYVRDGYWYNDGTDMLNLYFYKF